MANCDKCGMELECLNCKNKAKGVTCENCGSFLKNGTQYDKCPVCFSSLKVTY